MNQKTLLLLVALASFAGGVAIDRLVQSGSEAASEAGGDERMAGKRAAGSKSVGGPSRGSGEALRSRDGKSEGKDRNERSEGERRIHEIVDGIEGGDRITAALVAEVLEQIPDAGRRRGMIGHLAVKWGQQDPEAAMEWAMGLTGRDKFHALEHVLHGWSETDPAGAAQYVAQMPSSEHSLHMLREMARRWGRQDREAALDWSLALTNPASRGHALGGVVSAWAQGDPAAAAAFGSSLENPHDRQAVLQVAARQWANRDMNEAIEWTNSLPVGDRSRAMRGILREVAERDPGRAATLFGEMTAGIPEANREARDYRHMAHEIASMWSSSNPAEAASWAMEFPAGSEFQREAVEGVAENWLRLDSMAAGDWIGQLPQGDIRDAASERVVASMIHTDPEVAFAWADSVSDEGHRTNLMREVLSRWGTTDAGAAQAALGSANVTAEQRRELSEVFGGIDPPPNPGPDAEVPPNTTENE